MPIKNSGLKRKVYNKYTGNIFLRKEKVEKESFQVRVRETPRPVEINSTGRRWVF